MILFIFLLTKVRSMRKNICIDANNAERLAAIDSLKGDLMNHKTKRGSRGASREFIDWIRQDFLSKNSPYMFNLIKHAIYFSLTILIIWFMMKLTEYLFPNIPLEIKILIWISEITIIFHFAKENIFIAIK